MSKQTHLRFHLDNLDSDNDVEQDMVCFFCNAPKCEQSFAYAGGGGLKIVAVHERCADKHMASMTQTSGS